MPAENVLIVNTENNGSLLRPHQYGTNKIDEYTHLEVHPLPLLPVLWLEELAILFKYLRWCSRTYVRRSAPILLCSKVRVGREVVVCPGADRVRVWAYRELSRTIG